MGTMSFPQNAYGPCSECGQRGKESAPTSADSSSNLDTTGTGIDLVMFRGELMCTICRDRILDDEKEERELARVRRAESFRARAGFKKRI